jgi:hypothetical protein
VRPGDGWREISDQPYSGTVPEIPEWVRVGPDARRVYISLAALPQAATWGPGTWLELHLALPMIDRYLSRPGAEGLKALCSTLGAGLSLTELDLQRARIQLKHRDDGDEQPVEVDSPKVTSMAARRARLGAV